MSFVNPIWLYGLLGITIPILIHLWSKKEGKTIKVGSIKFFPESETRQSKRLYPNEIFLLILRSLLLTFLVLLIAQPILISEKKKERATILVESTLLGERQILGMLDTALAGNYDVRLLEQGLPKYAPDDEVVESKTNYWDAIREAEKLPSDELLVFSQNRASAFKGQAPSTSKRIKWFSIPAKEGKASVVKATRLGEEYRILKANFSEQATSLETLSYRSSDSPESILGLEIKPNGNSLSFKTSDQLDWVEADSLMRTKVSVLYDPEFEMDARLWTAAVLAIWETNRIPFEVSTAKIGSESDQNVDFLIWLSKSESVNIKAETILKYKADQLSKDLIKTRVNGYEITRQLPLKSVTSENIAEELISTFWNDESVKTQLTEADRRSFDVDLIQPIYSTEKGVFAKEQRAVPYPYWMIFMGLMGLERVISYKRKQ